MPIGVPALSVCAGRTPAFGARLPAVDDATAPGDRARDSDPSARRRLTVCSRVHGRDVGRCTAAPLVLRAPHSTGVHGTSVPMRPLNTPIAPTITPRAST